MKGRMNLLKIAALIAAILVLPAFDVAQKKCTVSGYMTDISSGESLINAALVDRSS